MPLTINTYETRTHYSLSINESTGEIIDFRMLCDSSCEFEACDFYYGTSIVNINGTNDTMTVVNASSYFTELNYYTCYIAKKSEDYTMFRPVGINESLTEMDPNCTGINKY